MTVRKTLKWLIVLVVATAAGGGGYAYLLWSNSNEMIRKGILAKCAEMVPNWDVALDRARFDWNRRIHLYNFTLIAKGQSRIIIRLPEVVLTIDRERFANKQEVIVQKVRLLGPILDLVRDAEGRWNWQQLLPLPKSSRSTPEIEIVQATVRVHFQQPDSSPTAVLVLQNAELKLIPSGKRQYLVTVLTQVSDAGKLKINGRWDLDGGTWWFNGQMNDVTSNGKLFGLAAGSSPDLRRKLARLQFSIQDYVASLKDEHPQPGRGPFTLASSRTKRTNERPRVSPGLQYRADGGLSDLGVSGTLDVRFSIARRQPKTEPEFTIDVDVRQGQIINDALPFPLRDLSGKIAWDNQRLLVRGMTAKNGMTRITLDGIIVRQGSISPARFDVTVSNLMLDNRLRGRLPARLRTLYDSVKPAGTTDLEGTLVFDGQSSWQPHDFVMTFHNCTATHVKFPYTLQGIKGTVRQHGRRLDVDLTGRAGLRPVAITGVIKNPGPTAEAFFNVHVLQMPFDETFLAACQPAVRATLESLKFEGAADVDLALHRPAGLNQKFSMRLSAHVSDASVESVHFPYRLSKFAGDIAYSTEERVWTFDNLRARHGTAKLTGRGRFRSKIAPGVLTLTITARDARFDKTLQMALPLKLQEIWDTLSPAGNLDLVTKVRWVPGQPVSIALPEAKVTKGRMILASFPYRLDDVEAEFSITDERVNITSFTGQHDRTQVRTKGFVTWTSAGDWRVRLLELYVDDLVPDRIFRRALPTDLRTVIEETDPKGLISLSGMVEFRGTDRPGDPVTAAWDLETVHSGVRLTTGLDLEQVFGRVTARGTWDGRQVNMEGNIDLDSVVVWDYQFTQVQGPYSINGEQVIVGSREILVPNPRRAKRRTVPPEERVTARAIGGVMTIDAAVVLQDDPSYHVIMTMSQGRLEQYAQRYLSDAKNLRGMMDAWVDLYGRGSSEDRITGRGRLRIRPAALYELPVVLQIANVVGPPDNTAFRYAFLDFDIANSQFLFKTIDLVGDAFSLRGRGTARFDKKLNLDFYSMLPRNRLEIPFISAVVGEATKGWVGVKIRGTTDVPVAKVTAAPQLDEALKRFLGAFGTRPPGSVSNLLIPSLAPPSRNAPPAQRTAPRTTRRVRSFGR